MAYDPDQIPAAEQGQQSAGWLCNCGEWNDHDEHCDTCGAEPPWGCDCYLCEDFEEPDDWDYEDYGNYDPR